MIYLIPKCPDLLYVSDCHGLTCLHVAAQKGHFEMVKYLVEQHKFDLTAVDKVSPLEESLLQFVEMFKIYPKYSILVHDVLNWLAD